MWKKILDSRTFLSFFSFLLGAIVTTLLWGKFPQWNPFWEKPKNTNPFAAFLTGNMDPLEEIEKMQKQMQNIDDDFGAHLGAAAPTDNAVNWSQRENADFFYVELKGKALRPEKLDVSVHNQQISISGTIEEKTSNGSETVSHFQRSFPAPANVDVTNFSMERNGETISIKFPKIKK